MNKKLNNPVNVYEKVAATMHMENFILKTEDKKRILDCVSGKKSFDNVRKDLVQKHTQADISE